MALCSGGGNDGGHGVTDSIYIHTGEGTSEGWAWHCTPAHQV